MRRVVVFSSAVVLVETIFFAALAPLLPGLEDDLGLSKTEAGILVAMYSLGSVAASLPGGLLATRIGIRATVLIGLVGLAAASVAFGLVDSYWLLDLTRFIQGAAAALCWTGALAWLVSTTPRDRRGETIGLVMAFAIGGALLGPVLGATASVVGRAPAFAGVAVIALLLALVTVRLPAPEQGETQPLRILLVALRRRPVIAGMWLLLLPAMLFGTLGVLAPLQLDSLGWGTAGVAATFIVSAAVEATVSPFVGRWSDRRGRLAPIRFGLVAGAIIALVIPWVENRYLASAVVVLAGSAFAVFWAPSMAMLSDGWEAAGVEHALGFALMNVAWAPGHVIGSSVGGGLADAAGDAASYGLLAALCLGTLAAIRFGRQRLRTAAA